MCASISPAIDILSAWGYFSRDHLLGSISLIHKTVGWDKVDDAYVYKCFDHQKPCTDFLVARIGEKIVGYAAVNQVHEKVSLLAYIAVDQTSHKKGIGSALLAEVVRRVKIAGMEELMFHCGESSSLDFYQKFAERKEIPFSRISVGQYSDGREKIRVWFALK